MITLECTLDGGLTLEIHWNCNDRVLNFYIEIYKNHYTEAYYQQRFVLRRECRR